MNNETKKIFDLQSDILSNHVLLKLIHFFATEKKKGYLYDTILPTKEVTKNELTQNDQLVPTTFTYSVFATREQPFINFTLQGEGLTPIEFYHVKVISQQPSINFLSSLAQMLIKLCRPCPCKIDKRFKDISAKYNTYFRYYEITSIWNDGLSKHLIKVKASQPRLGELENQIIEDINNLKSEYQLFVKLLSDMYRKQEPSIYVNEAQTYELSASISHSDNISMKLTALSTRKYQLKFIPIVRFHPSKPVFNKNDLISKEIKGCVTPYLKKK